MGFKVSQFSQIKKQHIRTVAFGYAMAKSVLYSEPFSKKLRFKFPKWT